MEVLIPWIVANTTMLLLLAGVFAYLRAAMGRTPLGWWAMGFTAAALSTATSGLDVVFDLGIPGALLTGLLAGACGIAYLMANFTSLNRAVPRLWWLIWAFAFAWVPVALLLGHRAFLVILPLALLVAIVLVSSGLMLVWVGLRRASHWLAGGGQLFLGLHMLDYGFFLQNPSLLPWGYLLATILVVVLAMGLVMMHFEEARRDLVRAEQSLAEARRMEAIGRLAGGVAHDFNNLLTVIAGSIELAELDLERPEQLRQYLADIDAATERARRLTSQLLVLGRRTVFTPEAFDLVSAIEELVSMLRRVTPENITLQTTMPSPPMEVLLDRTGVEQLVVNLVTNARDAMPDGGTIEVQIDYQDDEPAGVVLEVSDNGIGMDETTAARAFEPFFTTKGVGDGTGLGLATVQGVVTQMDGEISLRSSPGEGTRVRVKLPALRATINPSQAQSPPRSPALQILLVEDEPDVRRVIKRMLRRLGHEVRLAADGGHAWTMLEEGMAVDLVIADVLMPNIGGIELVTRLRRRFPNVAALLISGHPTRAGSAEGLPDDVPLLSKPFSVADLMAKLDELRPQQSDVG